MGTLTPLIRDAGYEVLYLLGGAAALAVQPTFRNADHIAGWIHENRGRKNHLNQLIDGGLVKASKSKAGDILQLTEVGARTLAGGRDPKRAWERPWDGKWRLLVFDLPQEAGRTRSRFWRWLRANHFGRLQGSVWVTPDPVTDLEEVMVAGELDPSMVLIFNGESGAALPTAELAERAWRFGDLNAAYRQYRDFAERLARQVKRRPPTHERFKQIMRDDRRHWWAAVKRDPLLPSAALPKNYEGRHAWKARQKFHRALGTGLRLGTPA